MKNAYKLLCVLLVAVTAAASLAGVSFAESGDIELGNSDINILNGGVFLTNAADFYYSEGGALYREREGEAVALYEGEARNLNRANGYIYFTLGGELLCLPESGGAARRVFDHGEYIKQLYIVDGACARYVSGGYVYERPLTGGAGARIAGDGGVFGLIPTSYGDIIIKGALFDYTLVVNGRALLSDVTGCYTDSGYLAVSRDGHNYMVELSRLFADFDESRDLLDFDIHGSVSIAVLFGEDGDIHECDVCQANAMYNVSLFDEETPEAQEEGEEPAEVFVPPAVSQGQKNIVLRARQMSEIQWTPLEDRYQWGARGIFAAGETYTGLPYGQPINTGYVPWTISFESYLGSVNNNSSVFYTKYSEYNKIAPTYSCDCSSYVTWAWGLKNRMTTYYLPTVAQKVSDQSIYGMQVGDCLNESIQHVVLVSDVRYNAEGELVGIDIMEQTPVITRKTSYGEGGSQPLSRIQSYYFGGGYVLYRNPDRDSVVYTHDCAVPLDGEYCSNCKTSQPKVKTSGVAVGSKAITLSHENAQAEIFYTLDGSAPTANSTPYTEPIVITSTVTVRAIAVTPQFAGSRLLEYTVSVPPVEKPTASVVTGLSSGNRIAAGSTVALESASQGAVLYYTLDGSEPTMESAKYAGPITINADTVIKCFGEAVGMRRSETAAIEYIIGQVFKIDATAEAGGTISPSGSVSAIEGSDVKFTFAPSPGFKISNVFIDGEAQGEISEYAFTKLTGNRSVSVSFKEVSVIPFTDVSENDWFFSAVNGAFRQGLFKGTTDTEFTPEGTMTRGMFITVLGRLAGVPAVEGRLGVVSGDGVNIRSTPTTESEILGVCRLNTCVAVIAIENGWHKIQYGNITGYIRNDLIKSDSVYSDIPAGAYYAAYAQWAGLMGIAPESGGGFAPERNITREEMSLMLYNYTRQYGITLKSLRSAAAFSDEGLMSASGRTAIQELYGAGVLNGMGDGAFAPAASATRAQVAQIFMSYLAAI